jgi:hypothetical protein
LRPQSAAWVLLFLWVPLLFYALSIAYGSVLVHVSTWWPFAIFNQRYGLQLLPMFAVSAGMLTASVFLLSARGRHSGKLTALMFALVVASYASVCTEAVGDTQSLEFLSTANRRPLAAPRQVSHGYLGTCRHHGAGRNPAASGGE